MNRFYLPCIIVVALVAQSALPASTVESKLKDVPANTWVEITREPSGALT